MKEAQLDPKISAIFESAANLITQKKRWLDQGFICDPCDPKLPLQFPKGFYGDTNQLLKLIVLIVDFIKQSEYDILFLKGPRGSGKTTFAHIFEEYSRQLNLYSVYQNASTLVSEESLKRPESSAETLIKGYPDVIFLDNAFYLHNTLRKLNNLIRDSFKHSPKIVAILDSTEFEIYRRECIRIGDSSYQNFASMPILQPSDVSTLLLNRLQVCSVDSELPQSLIAKIPTIAAFSLGNPGFAIRLLGEMLRFSQSIEETYITFGINPAHLQDFSPSKSPILREILIREMENDYRPNDKREYIIHKELTQLMNKTKSTISHHLSDLLAYNFIYEHSILKDKREKAYRPNKTIIGLLEYFAFEYLQKESTFMINEGINREK